ncbi:MAG: BACON domain-containing protein [Candidatus Cryptobacteroides sp.]
MSIFELTHKTAWYITATLILCSCGPLPSQNGNHFICAEVNRISIPTEGSNETITINSNCRWKLNPDIPLWCKAKVVSQDKFRQIAISVNPNDGEESRRCILSLEYEDVIENLEVIQAGNQFFQVLPMNTYKNLIINDSKAEICAEKMFISPINASKVYIGNILENKADDFNSLKSFRQFTFLPINMSAFIGGKYYFSESLPNQESTNKMANEIIGSLSEDTQNQNLSLGSPLQYTSLRQLKAIGYGNLGIPLDEATGRTAEKDQMKNRTGLIYAYCNELFSIVMDYQEKQVEEDISAKNGEGMVYINSISYGRSALLIIESNYNRIEVESSIRRYLKKEKQTSKDMDILSSIHVWYLYFGPNGALHSTKGSSQLIESYRASVSSSPIIPLNFTTNKFNDKSTGNISFKFKI